MERGGARWSAVERGGARGAYTTHNFLACALWICICRLVLVSTAGFRSLLVMCFVDTESAAAAFLFLHNACIYMLAYCLHLQSLLQQLVYTELSQGLCGSCCTHRHVIAYACVHFCIQLPGTVAILLIYYVYMYTYSLLPGRWGYTLLLMVPGRVSYCFLHFDLLPLG